MRSAEKKNLEKLIKISSRIKKENYLKELSSLILDCNSLWDKNKFLITRKYAKTVGPANLYRYVSSSSYLDITKSLWFDCLMSCENRILGSSKYASVVLCRNEAPRHIGRVSSETAFKVASRTIRNADSRQIIDVLYNEMSSKSIIQIYTTPSSQATINIENSLNLECRIEPTFCKILRQDKFNVHDCKIIVIDGSVASVSELNNLLENNNATLDPVLIFARGFFEEVTSTLAKNFKSKRLNIIPIVYGSDLHSINFISDISAISGCIPISRDFGDNISTSITNESKQGELRNVTYSKGKFSAVSDLDFQGHIYNLKNTLKNEKIDDKQKILARRISNLTSERIEVRIPESKPHIQEDCDDFIKTYRNIIESGLISLKGFGMLPINCYHIAKEVTNVFKQNVESIGCAICLDKESI